MRTTAWSRSCVQGFESMPFIPLSFTPSLSSSLTLAVSAMMGVVVLGLAGPVRISRAAVIPSMIGICRVRMFGGSMRKYAMMLSGYGNCCRA